MSQTLMFYMVVIISVCKFFRKYYGDIKDDEHELVDMEVNPPPKVNSSNIDYAYDNNN